MTNCRPPRRNTKRRPAPPGRSPRKAPPARRRTWPRWNTAWPAWASRSPPWRPSGRLQPRNHGNQGRTGQERGAAPQPARAAAADRGGPAGARPAPWPTAEEQLAECIRRAETSRWNILAGGIGHCRTVHPQGVVRRRDGPARRPPRDCSSSSGRELAAEAQRLRGKVRKIEERIHAQDLAANEVRARADHAGRAAARGLRHRPGRSRTTSPPISRSTSARRCRRRSTNCGGRSTPSAA